MLNKIFLLVLLSIPVSLFAGPVIISPKTLNTWKLALDAGYDVFAPDNDILSSFSIGMRMGLPNGYDCGLHWVNGYGIADIKHVITVNPSFLTTIDLETAMDSRFVFHWAASVLCNLELYSWFSFYFGAKCRYPAAPAIDRGTLPVDGGVFMPKIGIELLGNSSVTINLESGMYVSWINNQLGLTASGSISYKLF